MENKNRSFGESSKYPVKKRYSMLRFFFFLSESYKYTSAIFFASSTGREGRGEGIFFWFIILDLSCLLSSISDGRCKYNYGFHIVERKKNKNKNKNSFSSFFFQPHNNLFSFMNRGGVDVYNLIVFPNWGWGVWGQRLYFFLRSSAFIFSLRKEEKKSFLV